MFQRHLKGFLPAMIPAMQYWITRNTRVRAKPVRMILNPDPSTTPMTPRAPISQIIVKM